MIYIITFGGFLGLATFLPSFYYSQFHVTKIQAGYLDGLATLTGVSPVSLGGWFADKIGGITTLSVVFLVAIADLFGLMASPIAHCHHPALHALLCGSWERATEPPSNSSRFAGPSPPRSPAA